MGRRRDADGPIYFLSATKYPKGNYAAIFEDALNLLLEKNTPKKPSRSRTASQNPSRYIPREIQNKVWERDEGCCSYVSPVTGKRCQETAFVQFDHVTAWALGGSSVSTENIR